MNFMGLLKNRAGVTLSSLTMSRRRKFAALAVAGLVDLCQIVLFPFFFEGAGSPFDWVLDLAAAAILTAMLGFRWRLALALIVELIPGLDMFPTWTALVFSLPSAPKSVPESQLRKEITGPEP